MPAIAPARQRRREKKARRVIDAYEEFPALLAGVNDETADGAPSIEQAAAEVVAAEESKLGWFERLLATEPLVIRGAVAAVLLLLVAYGVPLSEEQREATLGAIGAVFLLVTALAGREAATPAARADAKVQAAAVIATERAEAEADVAIVSAYNAGADDASKGFLPAPEPD